MKKKKAQYVSQILEKWAVIHIHWNNPNVAGAPQTLFPVSKAEKLPLVGMFGHDSGQPGGQSTSYGQWEAK